MLQPEFLTEMLKKCRENSIHTAVDTAGNVPWESFEKIIPYTDLFLYDVKAMDTEVHKKYTGEGNELILENLAKLLHLDTDVWVRIPVICGVNDNKEEMAKIKEFFDKSGHPQKTELLPYHAMGEHKYTALGRDTEKFSIPDGEKMKKLKNIFGA